ncbi:hypothetical protein [Methylobacterium sp. Leaf466]|uniref:hypothetical protein n=1 Tax=Methylobacterium sp. Leaf466 TaxID=1736386 RepID=UPI000AA3E875|nr:hypothetical protein [Methylobacterium sp. Leaf466]
MVTEQDLAEWRTAGLKAGDLYGDELANALTGRSVEDADVQNLFEALGVSLQEEAQHLREREVPEDLIEEYTKAAVERVMLRMHAIRVAAENKADL